MKPIESEIIKTLESHFLPKMLEVTNESDLHHGPKGRESHFKVYIVSDAFKEMSRIQRQRSVFLALEEVMGKIHALALKAVTETEHQASSVSFESPRCASKRSPKI